MGFPAIHRPHAISFPPTPTYLTQFTDVRVNNNFAEYTERSASEAAPQQSGATIGAPAIEFDTLDLKTVLDLCTDGGVCGDFSSGTIALYYRKGKKRGLREAVASTVHDRFDLASTGFLCWQRITAEARRNAEITAVIKALSTDGATAPIVAVGAAALAGTSAVNGLWTLGPVTLNGAAVNSLKSITLDNRLTFDDEDGSGDKYQTYGGIDQWQPRLEILTNDVTVFDTYGEDGTALTALVLYLRKLKANRVGPELDATVAHIKITATAGTILPSDLTGGKAQSRLVVSLDKPDASTDPYTINTAIAIT